MLSKSRRNALVAVGLTGIAVLFASAPFAFRALYADRNLTMSPKPLSGNAVMRGAFINSGSKDAGRDPDWVDGVWYGKRSEFAPTASEIAAHRKEEGAA